MKRFLAPAALVGLVALGAMLIQHLERDRQYRHLLAEGERALQGGLDYAAVEAFSGALALRPDSMAAYYRRGEAYRLQRRDDWAMRDLREAIRLAPDAPRPLLAMAEIYDQRGDVAQAVDWYDRAAKLQDSDPRLLYSLALARYRTGFPGAAQAPLERALALEPTLAEAHYLLALVYRDAQDRDRAIRALEQAVRLVPSLTPAREELADLYRERGTGVDELIQLQALATMDDRVHRRVAIGLAEARRGQFDGALGTLGEAAVLAPTDPSVQLAIGRVLLSRAERQRDASSVARAINVLERALGGTARRSEGLALFGRAMYLSGEIAGAERILREAVATSPVDPEAFAFLADAAEALRHALIARDALVSLDALEGDTAAPAARAARARRIGALSLDAGDARLALDYLNHALNNLNNGAGDAGTLGLLARAKWQTGDAAGARAALRRAIEQDRTNAELQRLMRTIR